MHPRRLEDVLDELRVLRLDAAARLQGVVVALGAPFAQPVVLVVVLAPSGFCSRTAASNSVMFMCGLLLGELLEDPARRIEHGIEIDDADAVVGADRDLLRRQRPSQSFPFT